MIKARPNFNIVEKVSPVVDYESFKKDFLNPNIKVNDLKEKYNLAPSDYKEYRDRVLSETNLVRKPAFYGRDITIEDEMGNMQLHIRYKDIDEFKVHVYEVIE